MSFNLTFDFSFAKYGLFHFSIFLNFNILNNFVNNQNIINQSD